MAGLSHYCERDHQRTGTGDDCRQEYWKRRHKLNWTGRSNNYSACLHLGKTKENFGIVGVIQRAFFNSEYSPYLLPMFSFKKRRSMHVSNH
jgi:hypothetical protein